jgi:Domain of unknown function (DUF4386)
MNPNRKTATIAGLLYIIGTVAGILSAVFTNSIFNAPDFLVQVAGHETKVIIGVLFIFTMGFSLAMVPVVLYPILEKQNEVLAIGYVVFRGALETVTYIAIGMCMMLTIKLGQEYVAAGVSASSGFQMLSALLLKARDLCTLSTIFVFSLGALLFYSALYQSKLIPRWISAWGLIAIVLHLATGVLILFGFQTTFSTMNMVMNFPIFLQEMVMAVWLIVKGFNLSAIGSGISTG